MKYTEYSLFLHWKQGDDFADHLKTENNNVSRALLSWADRFKQMVDHCEELAKHFDGKDITAQAQVHQISFNGDEKLLTELVKKELLDKEEYECDDEELEEQLEE